MLTVKKFSTIVDIEERQWNSILQPGEIYNTHRFIRTVEESKIENANFFYLLFYDDQQFIGSAVLSAFNISLDLFISNNSIVRKLKTIFPNLFIIKLLVCGLPASFGQLNLAIADKKYASEISSLISKEMFVLSKELKIKLLAIKELQENERVLFRQFEKEKYFLAHSIPYMSMNIPWNNFNEYLSSLRHPYRRKILLSLKKLNVKKPVIISSSIYNNSIEEPVWVLTKPDEKFSENFYNMYMKVMERTPTKLETLNYEFFKNIFQQKDTYELLNLVIKGKIISSAILIQKEEALNFMLVGREFAKDEYDSYFNLIYGIIALGIERKCNKIKLGQTAYWVK
ncbi:MAG: peptidogalycan biosysnthesis protein, partial [Ginsengibacter sp.]